MNTPTITGQWPREQFEAWPFVWTVEDNTVLVTKNTQGGIVTVGQLTYKDYESAAEAAYKLACRQCRA